MMGNLLSVQRSMFLVVLLIATACHRSIADDLTTHSRESVLAEYPKALAVLQETFRHCNGEGIYSRIRLAENGEPKVLSRSKIEFVFSGTNGLLTDTKLKIEPDGDSGPAQTNSQKKSDDVVTLAYNNSYSFKVTKKDPEADYFIRWRDSKPLTAEHSITRGVGHFIMCETMVDLFSIATLIDLPKFHLDRVSPIEPASEIPLLKLEYSFPKKTNDNLRTTQLTSGWLIVSPKDRWLLHEYGLTMTATASTNQLTRVGRVEYARNRTGMLLPIKTESKVYPGGFTSNPASSESKVQPRSVEEFQFTKLNMGDTPDSYFTLAGFGLPEFNQTVSQASSSRSYVWPISIAALVALVLAFTFWRLASKDRSTSSQLGT